MRRLIIPLCALLMVSCKEDTLPKPSAYLRLEYPKPNYVRSEIDMPFIFDKNTVSDSIRIENIDKNGESKGITIEYRTLKGTIYLTYKKVDSNLITLLRDAQNLTQKHTLKADVIESRLFENPEKNVYGMFYEVGGNAASQSQFYATDSLHHFVSGSLYFYAKPNYDSLYPAAVYLKNDIKRIMESLEWKE